MSFRSPFLLAFIFLVSASAAAQQPPQRDDLDNSVLMQSKPSKIELRADQPSYTFTEIPTGGLLPAIYRLDILLGDEVAWRVFFRITE